MRIAGLSTAHDPLAWTAVIHAVVPTYHPSSSPLPPMPNCAAQVAPDSRRRQPASGCGRDTHRVRPLHPPRQPLHPRHALRTRRRQAHTDLRRPAGTGESVLYGCEQSSRLRRLDRHVCVVCLPETVVRFEFLNDVHRALAHCIMSAPSSRGRTHAVWCCSCLVLTHPMMSPCK